MKKLVIFFYIVITFILAIATFIEAGQGTEAIQQWVYGSSWFCAIWGVLAILGALYIFRCKLWKKPSALLLHISFFIILCGAFITWISGTRGYIHLREGVKENNFVQEKSRILQSLPFALELDSFCVEYYTGTEAPANYISFLTVTSLQGESSQYQVSMNNVLSYDRYRLYQSSYDEDGRGTWLSVNYDPAGLAVTYAGYALLVLSMLWVLCAPGGEFRRLLRHPLLRNGLCLLLLFALSGNVFSQKTTFVKAIWSKTQADSAASRQVIYHDRVVPFNTLARDFALKLTGRTSYKGLTPEQLLGSWLLYPEAWKYEPMILIKSKELRRQLGITSSSSYVRYIDFFNGSFYRLQRIWSQLQEQQQAGGKPSPLLKAVMEADEKIALITMLQRGELIRPLPEDGSVPALSECKIQAELLYNRIPFSKILFMINLTIGFLSFFYLCYKILYSSGRTFDDSCERKPFLNLNMDTYSFHLFAGFYKYCNKENFIFSIFDGLLFLSLLFHSFGMGLRWYIGGRIPLSNGYETMLFMAWCLLLTAWLLRHKFRFVVPFGFLLSGFALLVAWLGQMNPQITPLMPVLLSPWLSLHVSLIMMAYALFGFITLNGILGIILLRSSKSMKKKALLFREKQYGEQSERLVLISRLFLYPAVFFLGVGIFIGAVWANDSWGRYWAWDPKEVWALITFLVYAAAFHLQTVSCFKKPLFFHIYMVVAFLTVLMTYFGVNYVLGGMHSYAG